MSQSKLIKNWRGRMGESPTALFAMGTRLVAAGFAFLNGLLVVALFSPERVGIFLSFLSLGAFSAIADFGMSFSLLLAASTHQDIDARRIGAAAVKAALPFIAMSGTILFASGVLLFGSGAPNRLWLWPWGVYCVVASLQQWLMLLVTQAEGSGRRYSAWRANFAFEVVAGMFAFIMIALGQELWALPFACLTRIALICFLFPDQFDLVRQGLGRSVGQWSLWRHELWPMQWQTLLNSSAGLITTRLLTPILLSAEGAVAAGRMGLILALTTVISGATIAWPLSQTSVYAGLYDARDHRGFGKIYWRALWLSTALAIAATAMAGLACFAMRHMSSDLARHLPTMTVVWLILGAIPPTHFAAVLAIGLRAQRKDPVVFLNAALAIPAMIVLALAARQGPLFFSGLFLATSLTFTGIYAAYMLRFMSTFRLAHQENI